MTLSDFRKSPHPISGSYVKGAYLEKRRAALKRRPSFLAIKISNLFEFGVDQRSLEEAPVVLAIR